MIKDLCFLVVHNLAFSFSMYDLCSLQEFNLRRVYEENIQVFCHIPPISLLIRTLPILV